MNASEAFDKAKVNSRVCRAAGGFVPAVHGALRRPKAMKIVGCSRFSVRYHGNLKVEHRTDFRETSLKTAATTAATVVTNPRE